MGIIHAYLSVNVDMIIEDKQKNRMEYETVEKKIVVLKDRYNLLVDNLSDIIYETEELEH